MGKCGNLQAQVQAPNRVMTLCRMTGLKKLIGVKFNQKKEEKKLRKSQRKRPRKQGGLPDRKKTV